MPDLDREALGREMDGLAQRMGMRLTELRNRHELSQLRGQLTRIAERHRQLRLRFEAAQDSEWEAAKSDLSAEHGELFDAFVKFENKLDQHERERGGRMPGARSGLV